MAKTSAVNIQIDQESSISRTEIAIDSGGPNDKVLSPPHLTSKKQEQSGEGPPPARTSLVKGTTHSSLLEEQHDFKYECTMQTMENNLDDANMEHQDANISPGMT